VKEAIRHPNVQALRDGLDAMLALPESGAIREAMEGALK